MPYEPDFRSPLVQQPLWRQLASEVRERLWPPPEPELKLESQPVPVKDIWDRERHGRDRLLSLGIHLGVIGILMLPLWRPVRVAIRHQVQVEMFPTLLAPGPSLPRMKHLASGGAPPTPKLLPPKLNPVQAPPQLIPPPLKLAPATAEANLPLPEFGNPGAVAGPPGTSAGPGGAGPGGVGNDPNGGGDCLNAPCGIGGDISEPIPIYEPDPEYTDAARKAKFQGTVVVGVIIGADGRVYDPKIVQPLGLGLDQKALEAVKLWRFEPAKKNGRPVRVAANIEVNFRLY
ncbi:MAG TPA: TonB family protein [Terriglobales bacterium]|nr:TonB family protein [Terriglobales bacterium]